MRRCSKSDCSRFGQLLLESEFSGESLYCKECAARYNRERYAPTAKHRNDAKAYYQAHRVEILRKANERNARKRKKEEEMKDWNIEQLRKIETALHQGQGKRVYLNGEPCIIHHLMLVQPAFIANHPGKALEIDVLDTHGNKQEIRLYTAAWPEERRQ